MPKIGVLILAAGASVRMGQPKQLLPWKNTTLLGHTIEIAKSASQDIMLVLGANAKKIKTEISDGIPSIVNPDWRSGIGTSIAVGVEEMEKAIHPDCILIVLVDQPLIDSHYLKGMVIQSIKHPKSITATSYEEKAGVPALFPKKYFKELKQLSADYGARNMLDRYKDKLVLIEPKGKEIDLDTPYNYQSLWKKHGR